MSAKHKQSFTPQALLKSISKANTADVSKRVRCTPWEGLDAEDAEIVAKRYMYASPWPEAARNDVELFIKKLRLAADEKAECLPISAVDSLLSLPGFNMAAYIGEPAVRLYLHQLLKYLFNERYDSPCKPIGEFGKPSHAFASKFATAVVELLKKIGFPLPFRMDALWHYENLGMKTDYAQFSRRLRELTGHTDDSDE